MESSYLDLPHRLSSKDSSHADLSLISLLGGSVSESRLKDKTSYDGMSAQEELLLAGAVIGSAAIFLSSRGRARGLSAEIIQDSRLSPQIGRFFAQAEKQEMKGLFASMKEEAAVSGQGMSPEAAGGAVKFPLNNSSFAPGSFARSPEDEAKYLAADAAKKVAQAAQDLDVAVRDKALMVMRELKDSATVLKNPVTGAELNGNEHLYATYMDALPRKTMPEFAEYGNLAPGVYRLSFADFKRQFGYNTRRQELLSKFEPVLQNLSQAGVKEVHVGGSFVTKKSMPKDIDFLWNKHESVFDRQFLQSVDRGILLQHDSAWLKQEGLQMMVDPPPGGTYKGMQYFFAHGRAEWEGRIRGAWRLTGATIPKGLVELDLTTLPKQWLKEAAKLAA